MYTFNVILLLLFITVSILSLLPYQHWFFRSWDFPRLQLIVFAILSLSITIVRLLINDTDNILFGLATIAGAFLLYQLYMVFPYTRFAEVTVKQIKHNDKKAQVSLLVSNVLTPNDNTLALLKLIEIHKPDIVLTLESDEKWQNALDTLADMGYHSSVKVPLKNLYGMHLYSRLELNNSSVNYLVSESVPSITTKVKLRNGNNISLYCLHPEPPSPTEATTSKKRDAELLIVGKKISKKAQNKVNNYDKSCILAGDLNDVAWSESTKLFQRISGMLDPREGRGFFNTFHAKYPFIRWALDHVFVTDDFALVGYERLRSIDSDHFPVLTTLQHIPNYNKDVDTRISADDHVEAVHKINVGLDEAKDDNVDIHIKKNNETNND